jgi:cytochrome c'
MRVFSVLCAFLILACVVAAQAPKPAPKPAPAPATDSKPVGTLAQVMRGILFPNSNILFDVQSKDPETFGKKEEGSGASSSFSGIYTGWQVVENAAVALDEAARLIVVPGRVCENGRPVPITQKDWAPFVADLRKSAQTMLKAAQSKNKEAASNATNDVAGACENCHSVYRDAQPRCTPK